MYTFNYFCFGHKLSNNKELNNELQNWDFSYKKIINNRKFELYFPYHGGQVLGDTYSCVLGIIISSDESNPNYINEIRNAKESDYLDDYNLFLSDMLKDFDSDNYAEFEIEVLETIAKFKDFLTKNNPEFYHVEASS